MKSNYTHKLILSLKLIFISLFFIFEASSSVKDPFYDELEDYQLVEALIKDKKLDLARIELQSDRLKKNDPKKFHLLLGQLYYAQEFWKKSIEEFNLYPNDILSQKYLGRNYFEIKNYGNCVKFYDQTLSQNSNIKKTVLDESDILKKSKCEFELKFYSKSFATLSYGFKQFSSYAIKREMIVLQLKIGLHHEALRLALNSLASGMSSMSSTTLEKSKTNIFIDRKSLPNQYLDIAEVFHQHGRLDEALGVLEMGRSLYPIHMDLNLNLSQLYFQKNLLLASEEGFARAALTDGKYFYHVSELNRQIGQISRAQYFNNYIYDDTLKLKQKIATFVDADKFNLISSLKPAIQRSELNKDDEIKYALAYSLVKMGEVDLPLRYLSSIHKPELLEKTTVLKNAVLECLIHQKICHY